MTSAELVAHLATDCGQPSDVVRDLLQALADTAELELRAGRPLTVPGLCTLRVGVRLKGDGGQPEQIVVHWQSARELVGRLQGTVHPEAEIRSQRSVVRSERTGKTRPGRRTVSMGW